MRRSFQTVVHVAVAALVAATPFVVSAQVETAAQVESSTVVATPMVEAPQVDEHAAVPTGPVDYITPHITDGSHLELPYWKAPFYKEIALPHFPPIHIGGMRVDMSLTKHVVFMMFAAVLAAVMLISAAVFSKKQHAKGGSPHGFAAGIEAMALYLRSEVILPNVGPRGDKYVPFGMTLFFFILCCNLLGLIPYGSTATGNISVTATLAIITFFVVEISGIRAQGFGYLSTLFYWNKELPFVMRIVMFFVMSPVEMIGKLTKPFALAIRLFANMTAGHIVLLAIIGLIFSFNSWFVAGAPVLMATAISILELFVSFLQAFIFTLLASVFIGQIRESHH